MASKTQITIDDLLQYRSRKFEIMSIYEEIKAAYFPIKTASGNGSNGSTPGDPTAAAFHHIETLRNKATRLQKRNDLVNLWLETCEDSELAAICRLHYCVGKPWSETGSMLGFAGITVRAKVNKYFEI